MGIGNGIYRLNCTPEEIISIKILEEKKKIEKGKKCKYHKALGLACSCGVNDNYCVASFISSKPKLNHTKENVSFHNYFKACYYDYSQ